MERMKNLFVYSPNDCNWKWIRPKLRAWNAIFAIHTRARESGT